MTEIDPNTIHRVSHEIKRRRLQVLRVVDLTPRMRRITVGGPELAGFISLGTDDHVKVFFPQNAEERAALETFDPSAGKAQGPLPEMRDYTPRRYDLEALELDLDFVLHGDGPASTWAAQAEPGQSLHIGGPRGSMIVPDIFDSYLLIGDETALPAIARRLEGLTPNRRALVVVEVENGAEQQVLQSPAQVHVIWVLREGRPDSLLTTVQHLDMPGGKLYAWVATESKVSRQIRKVLLEEKGLDQDFVKAVGYWKAEGSEED
ncbi:MULTISPECIES: siderophore-interacting protein [unclassified Pseudomonas]|uniref:siderophore-interacting protein n=1 Tax=unclassified Pseudomonas TaxID=196821 RepID=UPI00119AA7A8|nr:MULTISPECIES: siderophore-interacting protein [unclassified Pseudomonas]TWC20386.1 NADPH-dependent ferric siderophore reductase [Pseudomonas sp. SJZ075]TWC25735.1 NADPH-dependent ferric siderophore reductase [Pseudomonas sp. SJZ074]TWC35816.1 NADPH-dependent ferric siderophore reductase [Pseudomonas sp. SJZ078]TWC42546.1 NADPH-dependent ferric siderophore reductase [Pseudomonas sp. SJZ085]TWC56684.1 NADPH-dependent ferric siderophore reductase [Pseudomonas sp. SJZ124]